MKRITYALFLLEEGFLIFISKSHTSTDKNKASGGCRDFSKEIFEQ
ncbi:hypothetical protein [Ferdinandcohnia sp. SAFN-114]